MATTAWNTTTINGKDYLVVDSALFRIPLDWDPNSNMFIAVAAPTGGLGNMPALVQGDPGVTPTIDTTINLTALEYDDATADSAEWTEISPDTYQLSLSLHKGAPGDLGYFGLQDADDITTGTLAAGQIIVGTSASTFGYQSPKVGDRYVPASVANCPSGQTAYTLATVGVPAQPWAWRPIIEGTCIITGTGADVRADLIARLDGTSGNEIGRGFGSIGVNAASIATTMAAGPPPASADGYDKVAASTAATIYFRIERQTGGDTFTTSSTTSRFAVRVQPVP